MNKRTDMAQKRAREVAEDVVPGHVPPAPPRLDRNAQARLGEQLRAMYDDLLQQPIPDRFVDLLKDLDDIEQGKSTGKSRSAERGKAERGKSAEKGTTG
jgi:hypothetical protein